MAASSLSMQGLLGRMNVTQLAAPILILMILAMMVLPLPAFVLDVFFTFNIAISVLVLLVAVNTQKTLDFSVFPTVLLVTTLLRLSLNVASTRIVMLEGHNGPDAAGKVIEAFGHFLVGGNFAVGIMVFLILVVINFVVITKGAGRVAEVSARFTLDAMPGKQMAIDADLNAGLIGEEEARKRRTEISREAEFFGSMDGASKFVRGDAVAGIIIMLLNVVGGLIVGVLQHNMELAQAAKNYTLLTIGDGLVAQIPGLIISIAAGMVVTRVSDDRDIGQQVMGQMFRSAKVLGVTAAIVGFLGLIPGMPNLVFLMLASSLGWFAWTMAKREKLVVATPVPVAPAAVPEALEASWSDVAPLDVLGLEVGYRLIPLVDKSQDGELLRRIRGIRKKFAQEVGFLVSPVHIRDNLELKPNAYRILLKGVEVGQGEAYAGQYLAINPGRVAGTLNGATTKDPAFGLPATWIDAGQRDQAQAYGYTVVDASTVVATHLNHLILTHAAELLGRQEVQQLLDHLAKEMPKLVEDLVPKVLPLGILQKVLQAMLEEGVHIRDMRTIIETVADHATRTQNADDLSTQVRMALGRAIVQQIFPGSSEMQVMSLDPTLERLLSQAVAGGSENTSFEPGLADTLVRETAAAAERQEGLGLPAVLLVPGSLRLLLSKFLRRTIPQLKVLSHNEVPEARIIKVTSIIGGRT
ncbi:flagellar biosynthesis protein FlhA [Ferribacterium limneticum]|uniref:flagellar biosynthesis protein FlhA n=1 Tax=Ferribacterium limneticum TaxID=76259 RepID=UPI001CF9BF75|nr:flagellar biosynthesis protein FlhA [Ferribacterium limneticum]UCV27681.1 flagellar biosynthesis protein FlhA [Ferribacterium limneticum]UCV31598.1 flagellar biosynthesis protein FlhA [Ferribacterium limneticum]